MQPFEGFPAFYRLEKGFEKSRPYRPSFGFGGTVGSIGIVCRRVEIGILEGIVFNICHGNDNRIKRPLRP